MGIPYKERIRIMDNLVITIAREFGSGGRSIGKMLSEKLSIPYYDKDLIKLASEDSGINEALFVFSVLCLQTGRNAAAECEEPPTAHTTRAARQGS